MEYRFGNNTKAAVIRLGMLEMRKLVKKMVPEVCFYYYHSVLFTLEIGKRYE